MNNFADGRKLRRHANTYFVAMPSLINGNQIECLTQFGWGYVDDPAAGRRNVTILPFEETGRECRRDDLALLRGQFPGWTFAE